MLVFFLLCHLVIALFTKPGNCHLLSEEKINLLSDCACVIYNIIIFYTVCASTYELKIVSVIFNLLFVAYKIGRDLHM